MKRILRQIFFTAVIGVCWILAAAANPSTDDHAIDGKHSSLHVHVYKTGFFSAFAHNHEIEAPIESGVVIDSGNLSVDLHVDARKMRVLDPDVSEDTRAQIQKTMQGPQVLDANHHPEIHFYSTAIEAKSADHWLVTGNLELHGQTHPLVMEVTLQDGVYKGSATLKQTTFGITPITVAGGAVKVKDELKIEFAIALAR